MPLTAESMAAKRKARRDAVAPLQTDDPAAVAAKIQEYLVADSQGIIDAITADALVTTTSGAPDGEHQGNIS
ncbi:hypothetical protein [Desulfoluna butyratoxydans]|uniref:Uncharacterized protein n=1 Tax=Desulfoluna butyratoxydans TaxID=231438 RepID=A0A4U8YSW1_9BACT|nr:hypothetical protein [Desulfoluna butyratoxydans]VFQ44383.1 hypothetical protein MSL71_20320 [Desulfoluna butyratoxydans]